MARSITQPRRKKPHEVLKTFMVENGLKASRQRDVIAEVFFHAGDHLKVEELLERVKKVDARISQATVYRTMKLLTECGLALPRTFHDGQTRYELSDSAGEHHDHLVCTSCGQIIEFVEPRIEALQEEVAKQYGYQVTVHRMELYGLCGRCQKRGRKKNRS